jgi:hypothetical protein
METEESVPVALERPGVLPIEPDVTGGDSGTEAKKPTCLSLKSRVAAPRGVFLGLAFLAGLLIGWVVIGWWLWPVQWTNSKPWLLHPEYQRTYVNLAAESYWCTNDLSQAREVLSGWDEETLTDLLVGMQARAASLEERQRLDALARALALPNPKKPLLSSLLDQKLLVLSTLLSVVPLVVAVILAVFPRIRNGKQRSQEALGQSLEELEGELERILTQEEQQETVEEDEGGEEDEKGEGEQVPGKADDGERDGEDDYEEDDWANEEVGEDGTLVKDILADLFEEEDETLLHHEALCKDLEDLSVDDLIGKGQEVLEQLVRSNELRRQ